MRAAWMLGAVILSLAACGEGQETPPRQDDAAWRETRPATPTNPPPARRDGPKYTGNTY